MMKTIKLNRITIINKTVNIMHKIFDKDYERLFRNNDEKDLCKNLLYTLYDTNNKFIYNHKTKQFVYFGYLGYVYKSYVYKPIEHYVLKEKNLDNNEFQFLLKTNILTKFRNDVNYNSFSVIPKQFEKYNSCPNTIFGFYRHIHFIELLDKKK